MGIVGGINVFIFVFWQNKMVDVLDEIGMVNVVNVFFGMNKLWLECICGMDVFDFIILDDMYFIFYKEKLQFLMRFLFEQEVDVGFMNYWYKCVWVLYDGDVMIIGYLVGMYFINIKYFCFKLYEGVNF